MVHKPSDEQVRLPLKATHAHMQHRVLESNVLYESLDKESKHNARIVDTDAARHCGLRLDTDYVIVLTSLIIKLTDIQGNLVNNLTWPYKFIRRYGRSKTSFTFEAGRKCPCGEGLFTFKVQSGDKLFDEVQQRTRAMKTRPVDSGKSDSVKTTVRSLPENVIPIPAPSSPENQPPLPARRYGSEPFASLGSQSDIGHFANSLSIPPPVPSVARGSNKQKDGLEHSSKGSSDGTDQIDGHLLARSPNMAKRLLPEIPKSAGQKHFPLSGSNKAPLTSTASLPPEHIYEDADKLKNMAQKSMTKKPQQLPHHYAVYDVTQSSRSANQQHDVTNGERHRLSPSDLQREVPCPRQVSLEQGDDEQYSSIPDDEYDPDTTADYAEPVVMHNGVAKVSSLLSQLKTTPGESDVYSTAGDTYGSLDLINTQVRSLSEPAVDVKLEQIYGRLSAAQTQKPTPKEFGSYYANTAKAKPK